MKQLITKALEAIAKFIDEVKHFIPEIVAAIARERTAREFANVLGIEPEPRPLTRRLKAISQNARYIRFLRHYPPRYLAGVDRSYPTPTWAKRQVEAQMEQMRNSPMHKLSARRDAQQAKA